MAESPRTNSLDSTINLLKEGYPFAQDRVHRYHSDLFRMRLMGRKAISIHGEEAAKIFYNPELFFRKGAIPKPVQKTLLGENGIHTLDGNHHRCRKEMFVSVLMEPHNIQDLMVRVAAVWQAALPQWEHQQQVLLFTEVQKILTRAACDWAGMPLPEQDVEKRAKGFIAMIDAFGSAGFRHIRGRRARSRMEIWVKQMIRDIRAGKLLPEPGTPACAVAWHREPDGELLDEQMAAVELLNAVRPFIAVTYYVLFIALSLHRHPHLRRWVQEGGELEAELFVQEVRRFYPFTPVLGANVRKDFVWQEQEFKQGTMVVLDVYGTLHDPRLWEAPETFNPERFRNYPGRLYDLIPQGGGDFLTGHRCPGEWITIEGMKVALHMLTKGLDYTVPEQDLSYDLSRMPSVPKSRFIITNIRRKSPITVSTMEQKCPLGH